MVTFTGSTTINNSQINDNTQGNVTMNVGVSNVDLPQFLNEIKNLAQEHNINDPELTAILSSADSSEESSETTLDKLNSYLATMKSMISTGDATLKFGENASKFVESLSNLMV